MIVVQNLALIFIKGTSLPKPKVIHGKRLPARRYSLLKLLTCLYDPDVDMRELEESDPSGCLFELSACCAWSILPIMHLDTKVESIRHALGNFGLETNSRLVDYFSNVRS